MAKTTGQWLKFLFLSRKNHEFFMDIIFLVFLEILAEFMVFSPSSHLAGFWSLVSLPIKELVFFKIIFRSFTKQPKLLFCFSQYWAIFKEFSISLSKISF
jgi:hypothetical protein